MKNMEKILKTFGTVNEFVMQATEKELKELLDAELKGQRRFSVVNRLHGRYSELRTRRERLEALESLR